MTTARKTDLTALRADSDRHLRRAVVGSRRSLLKAARRTVVALVRSALIGAWGIGFGLTLASAATWLMPGGETADALLTAKLSAALLLSMLLARIARPAGRAELRFDSAAGLLREVRCRRDGRLDELARWSFDEFDAVEIQRGTGGTAKLSLRFGQSGRMLQVAKGSVAELERMAYWIERDTGLPYMVPLHRVTASARPLHA